MKPLAKHFCLKLVRANRKTRSEREETKTKAGHRVKTSQSDSQIKFRKFVDETDFVKWSRLNSLLVFLSIISKDKIFQSNFNSNPFIIRQRRPYMMWLCDCCFVWLQNHFSSVTVYMKGSQDENQTRECRVRGDSFQPIVIQIEQYHLRLCRFQDQISKLLNLFGVRVTLVMSR